MPYLGPYYWMKSVIQNKILLPNGMPSPLCNHMAFLGASMTGKTYLMDWLAEFYVQKGIAKVFYINCTKNQMTQERTAMQYPNIFVKNKELKQLMNPFLNPLKAPSGFKVNFYLPVSAEAPDKLPENYIPFTIPVDDLGENSVQILYGSTDSGRIYNIYKTQIREKRASKKITYAKMKNIFRKYKHAAIFYQPGFQGVKMSYFASQANVKTVNSFISRMQIFNSAGTLSRGDNPLALKNTLREELLDQKTVCVLNTEYLKSTTQEYFSMSYFIQAMMELLEEEGIMNKIPYRILLIFDDVRFLFPSKDENQKGVHSGMADLGATLLSWGRHKKMEIWFAVQSPRFIPSSMFTNIQTKFVTHFRNKEDIQWFREYYPEITGWRVNDLFKSMERQRAKGKHPFIVMEDPISERAFLETESDRWAYELPRPRLSGYRYQDTNTNLLEKVPITPKEFSVLKKDPLTGIDLGIETVDEMGKAKKELENEYRESEEELKEILKKEREERKAKKEQDEKEFGLTYKIAKFHNLGMDVPEIVRNTGESRERVNRLIGKARIQNLLVEKKETMKAVAATAQ